MPLFSSSSPSVNEIHRSDLKKSSSGSLKRSKTSHLRRSITDSQVPSYSVAVNGYHNTFPNASTSQLETSIPPPAYDEFDEIPLPRPRFKVTPRLEEGREDLPSYKCSITKEAMFDRKIEMDSPFERAGDRKWTKCYCVLNNTVLNIHRIKRTGLMTKADLLEEDPDDPTGYAPGPLIKSYTLQHAEIGAANDYKKRNYVIRVRAETQQFLLACKTVETFFGWLEALGSGIDLALPLEERTLPKYQTIPRRRRRRRQQDMYQQQDAIIRRHYPQLLGEAADAAQDPTLDPNDRPATASGLEAIEESARVSDLDDGPHPSGAVTPQSLEEEQEDDDLVDLETLRITQPTDHSSSSSTSSSSALAVATPNTAYSRPSTATEGQNPFHLRGHLAGFAKSTSASVHEQETRKWRGGNGVSRESNLRFAKRCMAVLNANAPRHSNMVIERGIRYRLVPGECKMIPDERITLRTYQHLKSYQFSKSPLLNL